MRFSEPSITMYSVDAQGTYGSAFSLEAVRRLRSDWRSGLGQWFVPPQLCDAVPEIFALLVRVEECRDVAAGMRLPLCSLIMLPLYDRRHVVGEPMRNQLFLDVVGLRLMRYIILAPGMTFGGSGEDVPPSTIEINL